MIRHLLLLFLLSLSLYALSDALVLNRADSFMKGSSKSDYFRAYNDYKNIYLRSMVSEDENLQKRALKGIIKSGEKLHIDVSNYQNELSKMKVQVVKKAPVKELTEKDISPQEKSPKKINIKAIHVLQKVEWQDESLVLTFDDELPSSQVKYFSYFENQSKTYKYVFDIDKSMLNKMKIVKKNNLRQVKIAQYDTDTLRLVIENDTKIENSYKIQSKQLIVTIPFVKESITDSKNIVPVLEQTISPIKKYQQKIIVLDAGHGGKDPGAIGYNSYKEKDVVLQIALYAKSILKSRGYTVYTTRDRDRFVKLRNRTKFANKKNADLFISIHANAVDKGADSTYGIECYFLSPSRSEKAERVAAKENSADLSDMNMYGKKSFLNFLNYHKIVASNKLAIDLQRSMLATLKKSYRKVKDAGVREGPFWVLVGAQMPSVLIEVGFITNPKEARRLVLSSYQKKLALGIANGVERYFLKN